MKSINEKMAIVLFTYLLRVDCIEDLEDETSQEIDDKRYNLMSVCKEKRELDIELFCEGYEVFRASVKYSNKLKKEGFYPPGDNLLNGYLECFFKTLEYKACKVNELFDHSSLSADIDKEYHKILFFLYKRLGKDIVQRRIDHPHENIQNQEGIEFCEVLHECLQRMYFQEENFLKMRREVFIDYDIVDDIQIFMEEMLHYLIGDIGCPYTSYAFLMNIQNQLNANMQRNRKEKSDEKRAYLLFLCTCLNEIKEQSLNHEDSIYNQVEYTYKKEIAEAIEFCFHYFLKNKLEDSSKTIEEVLEDFYLKERKNNNGITIQKISKLFRKKL